MTSSAASIIETLATIDQRFVYLANELRKTSEVTSVKVAVSPKHYADADRVECYVDAELESGNAVVWWFEFRIENGSWIIESSVRHNTKDGQDELIGLPDRHAVDDDELNHELSRGVESLVKTLNGIDLAKL